MNYWKLVPAEWDWERDAVGFYNRHMTKILVPAVLYYPVIYGIKATLKNRKPFDLGGSKTSCKINWIFWWETGLAVFSILGTLHIVPLALEPIISGKKTIAGAICMDSVLNDPRGVWVFYLGLSKIFEFGDTLFVVLRKRPLILLQHWHHFATMLYCTYGIIGTYDMNNSNVFFAAMNYTVHSIMYTWYATTRLGWRSPRWCMICVTLMQLFQMVCGVGILLITGYSWGSDCGPWATDDPIGFKFTLFMYASYMVLFAKLFCEKYLTLRPKLIPGWPLQTSSSKQKVM